MNIINEEGNKFLKKFAILGFLASAGFSFNAFAEDSTLQEITMPEATHQQPSNESSDDPMDLSLEELMDAQVYSASKRPEKLSEVPAAAYVLSSEDIARSGVNTIPEALRLVPGVQVAQTAAHTWAITIRGFNRQFSNKLLVMIDGRTVYTPLFSGVFWDVQDYVLEDIDRIEVIRGPGGTLWGANAVNGVINIITKEARKTQGNYISGTVGTHEDAVEVRNGGVVGDSNFYRVYGKAKYSSEFKDTAADRGANDNWQQSRAGFRYDFRDWDFNPVTLQGDVYSGKRGDINLLPTASAPFSTEVPFNEQHSGGNVMLNWEVPVSDDVSGKLGAYIDYIDRDSDNSIEQQRVTYNVDFQLGYETGRHNLIGGAEARFINDDLTNTTYVRYTPTSTSVNIFSVFLQDKIELMKDELYLTLGTKFDYNDYTGTEVSPNIRLLWEMDDNNTVWGAVSRAVRTPSRGEDSLSFLAVSGYPLNAVYITGNNNMESENMIAYELGYRSDINKNLFFDVTGFYNDYDDLRVLEPQAFVAPIPLRTENNGYGESYGVELASVMGVTEDLDVRLSSTFLKQTFHLKNGSNDSSLERDEKRSPEWQHSINTTYRLSDTLTLNNNLMYVDELTYYATTLGTTTKRTIDDYVRLDAILAYTPNENTEISVVGQNLLDSQHQEFDEVIYSNASEVPRSAFVKVKYKF